MEQPVAEQPSQLLVLPAGRSVDVQVPATSANLGPGFDCLGLALDWRDTCTFQTCADAPQDGSDVLVKLSGEGAGRLPTDANNLIVRSLQTGLERIGVRAPGLVVTVVNTIPQGRGLGSSSAAIVAGLAGAHGLAQPGTPFDPAEWLPVASRMEGHPDNVAAALFGGLVLAYSRAEHGGEAAAATAVVHPAISGLVLIPEQPLATEVARSALPPTVPHADAAANAGRAALLVHALTTAPELLFEATVDRLHQPYRAPAMRTSAELLEVLRSKRIPAVVSGAGPSLLVLGTAAEIEAAVALAPTGFRAVPVKVGEGVRLG